MSTWLNTMLPNSASPMMEQLIFFHDHALMILIMITTLVTWSMISLLFNSFNNRFLMHGQLIEIIWTLVPAIILLFIAFPSLQMLYLMDEINEPMITIKSTGHQWYWSYEYSTPEKLNFDSYMIPLPEMIKNQFRLLDVDNSLILPFNTQIRMLVTSTDVIHSWTIPSLGIKMDAMPGRLNQMNFLMNRPGIFSGQCSEICGNNHSFMPIIIKSISFNDFLNWIK